MCRSPSSTTTGWPSTSTNTRGSPFPILPIDRRTGITEVETGFTEEQARREASRCLQCWINTIFEGDEEHGTECILCGGCVDVCPENCLTLVPLSQFHFSDDATARLDAECAAPCGPASASRIREPFPE